MKPSNTGRDWDLHESIQVHVTAFAMLSEPTVADLKKFARDVSDAAESITRKELAAKVGAVRRYDYVSYGGDYELELNAEGDYANVHDVLSLLNENDDAE